MTEDQTTVYRCAVCNRRIKRELVAVALSRGKVPRYCGPAHRNTGKSRKRRARKTEAATPEG